MDNVITKPAPISFYPIRIDEIIKKVEKKRKEKFQLKLLPEEPMDNVKEAMNEYNEKIIRVDGEIPIELPVKNKDRFLFISYDQTAFSHGIHKYPAKFFPELPRWLIKRYSKKDDFILDPFSGSGTTNVEALLSNRNSVGIDVDPFSRFISQVKVTPLDENGLNEAKEYLIRSILNYNASKISEKDIPQFPYRNNWFNKEIILELAYLKKKILSLEYNNNIKRFFLVCFSSIIRSVSNADDNCIRTVIRKKLNKQIYPADALKKFVETILIKVPKMIEFSKNCSKNNYTIFPDNMDARDIKFNDNTFDLAVTSPPYVNAVDYPRTHQLEIYWLGFENGSLTPLKRKHVGTESVLCKDYKKLHKTGIKEADNIISKIFKKDPRRAYICYKYLYDMQLNLQEVHRVLKKGGKYIIVVGNNKIRNEVFENWKYIMKIAEKIKFKVENFFGSDIIKHFIKVPREERINIDWILILEK